MNKDVNPTNSGKISVLIDFSNSTNATQVYHNASFCTCKISKKNTLEKHNKRNVGYFGKNCPKVVNSRPKPQVTRVTKKQGCDLIQYNSVFIVQSVNLFILCKK